MIFDSHLNSSHSQNKPNEEKSWESDIEFLMTLISNLRNCRPNKKISTEEKNVEILRRSAISIVLRFNFGEYEVQDLTNRDPNFRGLGEVHKANLEAMGFTESQTNNQKSFENRVSELIQDARRYHSRLEILFIKRATRERDRWSGHVSFPGGKQDVQYDLNDFDTATRESHEEIGMDLKSSAFLFLGELDDRFVKSRFGLKNLLVLSPQIFLQTEKISPILKLESGEVALAEWVPVSHFLHFVNCPSSKSFYVPQIGHKHWFNVDLFAWFGQSNLSKSMPITQAFNRLLKLFLGGMHFTALPLPAPFAPTLLWGITLNILSDLVDLGHSSRKIQTIVPLEYPLPVFDLWPISPIMHWLCCPDPLRKPATCRPSSSWDNYFRTLHWVGSISLAARLLLTMLVIRFFIRSKVKISSFFARLSVKR